MKKLYGFSNAWADRPFLAVLKKTLGADYEQLLKTVFSCFQGQKSILYLFWKYFSIRCIAYRWEKIKNKLGSILFWLKIGYSHKIKCAWEGRISMFPVLDTNLWCWWRSRGQPFRRQNRAATFKEKFRETVAEDYYSANTREDAGGQSLEMHWNCIF